MTYSSDRRDDYANQGQQDDYFEQDLAIAGHEPKDSSTQDHEMLEAAQNQGQQDDYFEQDLASSDRS